MNGDEPRRRSEDAGWITRFYDWVDDRQIDKHLVSVVILFGTVIVSKWAMHFAEKCNRPGLEVAAIIAAVTGPYCALQAAAISFYFRSRQ